MTHSVQDLGEQKWNGLGVAEDNDADQVSEELSWIKLAPLLQSAKRKQTGHIIRSSVIYLEALHDPYSAIQALHLENINHPLQCWLLYQLALQTNSLSLFSTWSKAIQKLAEERVGDNRLASNTFTGCIFFDPPDPSQDFEISKSPLHFATRLEYQILLPLKQRWEDLATIAENAGSSAWMLLAAHIYGDRLERRDKQRSILQTVQTDDLILSAEALLEFALRSGNSDEIIKALNTRCKALQPLPEYQSETNASYAVLKLLQPGQHEDIAWLPLNDSQIILAWNHLSCLIDRFALASQPFDFERLYRKDLNSQRTGLSQVWSIRLAEILMAQNAWGDVLDLLPSNITNQKVREELCTYYRILCLSQMGQWHTLGQELLPQAETNQEQHTKAALLHIATLLMLKQPDLIKKEILVRIREQLKSFNLSETMMHLATLLCAFRLIDDLEERIYLWNLFTEHAPDPTALGFFNFAYGLLQLKASNPDRALAAFQADKMLAGDEPATIAALAIALSLKQDWTGVVKALIELSKELEEPASSFILRKAAHCAVTQAGDANQGLQIIQQLIESHPEDLTILKEAAALNFRAGHYETAGQLFGKAAQLTTEPERGAQFLCNQAEVLLNKLNNHTGAEEAYWQALAIYPNHAESLNALHRLLAQAKRYRELPSIIDRLLQIVPTDSEKLELHLQQADVHRKLWEIDNTPEDAEACIQYCDLVLEHDPSHEVAIRNLVAVCEKLDRWHDLIKRLDISTTSLSAMRGLIRAFQATSQWSQLAVISRRLAESATNTNESLAAILRAGDIYQRQLQDLKTAEECYRWATDRFKDIEPYRQLAELYRDQNRHHDLVGILEHLASAVLPPEQLKLHLELGQLYAKVLNQPRSAIQHYEKAVELDPTCQNALQALEPLLEQEGTLTDLARILDKELQIVVGGPEELRILLKLGTIYQKLGDDLSLLPVTARIHNGYYDNLEAVRLLEEVYQYQKRFVELCELYARRIQYLESQPASEKEIAGLFVRKGKIEFFHFGQKIAAAESFTRVMELQPEDAQTFELLEKIMLEVGDWQRLMAVHEKRANTLKTLAEQVTSLHQAAKIALLQLKDEAETTRLYERIYTLDPTDIEAFSFLEKKFERRNEYRLLIELLVSRAERVKAGKEELEYLLRAALICEEISDINAAEELYKRALVTYPHSRRALAALSRIYEARESWHEFLEITRRQIELEDKLPAKALLYFKCGSVMETKYHDEKEAVRHYQQAIKTSPACLPALHSLRDVYSRRKNWQKVVETLAMESQVWTDKKGKAEVLAQMAEIYLEKLNDRVQSLQYYRAAIESHPENMTAALALFEAYAHQGNYIEAAVWGDIYARQVHHLGSQAQQMDFFVRWAEVLRQNGRFQEAAHYLVMALEIRPGQVDTLFALLDLCREAPESYDFAHAFAEMLKDANRRDDNMANAILLTAGGVLAEHRADINAALDLYGRALQIGGEHIRLARPMADLLILLGQEKEAIKLITRCQQCTFKEKSADWITATQWLVDFEILWRSNYDKAIDICRAVLEEYPQQYEIRLRLAKAELMCNHPELAEIEYKQICQELETQGIDLFRLAQHYHAWGIASYQSNQAESAESAWRKACELAPEWPYPYIALARMFYSRGDYQAADTALAKATEFLPLGHPDITRTHAELYGTLGLRDEAIQLYQQLVEGTGLANEDKVSLARHLLLAEHSERSIALLKNVILQDGDYYPAIRHLKWAATTIRDTNLARHVEQVIDLALGNKPVPEPFLFIRGPIRQELWDRLMDDLNQLPLHALWNLFEPSLRRLYAIEPPHDTPLPSLEVQLVIEQMVTLFGVKRIMNAQDWSWLKHLLTLQLPKYRFENLELAEVRVLMAIVFAAVKGGYSLLLGLSPEGRFSIGRKLASFLKNDRERSPEMIRLLSELSRREQRQVERLVAQQGKVPTATEENIHNWLRLIDDLGAKVALLLTEDLISLARILGIKLNIPAIWLAEEKIGLLSVIPQMHSIVGYFLSDEFQHMRLGLQTDKV